MSRLLKYDSVQCTWRSLRGHVIKNLKNITMMDPKCRLLLSINKAEGADWTTNSIVLKPKPNWIKLAQQFFRFLRSETFQFIVAHPHQPFLVLNEVALLSLDVWEPRLKRVHLYDSHVFLLTVSNTIFYPKSRRICMPYDDERGRLKTANAKDLTK